MHFQGGFRLISWNNIFKARGWYWSITHPWDTLSEMYHSLSKWTCPKAKFKACLWEIHMPEYLVISTKDMERERNPSSISVFKQKSSSTQPGCPSSCLEDEPCSKAWLSIPLKHTAKYCLTPNSITSSIQYLQKNTLICILRTIEKLMEMIAIHTALSLLQWKGQTN